MSASERQTDERPSTIETIAAAYLKAAGDDPVRAIHSVIADALVDLCEAERRTTRRDRLISRGYVRAGLSAAKP